MILYNKTQKKIVTNDLKIAKTFVQNISGLIFESKNTAMLFHTRFGIHTFFMKYPIDVVVLNDNLKIVQIRKNLKPNKFFFWPLIYKNIIELNEIKNLNNGDVLEIILND